MDSISDIMEMIKPGDYFTSIDLTDAYYCIAMHLLSMPYLTFIFLNIYSSLVCPKVFLLLPEFLPKL